jgi:dTDP-4-dehydrorhamnose reductase
MKRVFIVGISGFVGSNLALRLSKDFRVFGTYYRNYICPPDCDVFRVDLFDQEKMFNIIKKVRPFCIIHAAGVTDLSYCQSNQKMAEDINAGTCRYLIGIAETINSRFILLSCDAVFDGRKGNYTEYDKPSSLNEYGRSKKSAEIITAKYGTRTNIIRLASVYGLSNGRNLSIFDKILLGIANKEPVKLISGTKRSYLYISDGAELVYKVITESPKYVLYNLGGEEACSEYELGLRFTGAFNPKSEIITEYRLNNPREMDLIGRDCTLTSDRIKEEFNIPARSITEGIADCMEKLKRGF